MWHANGNDTNTLFPSFVLGCASIHALTAAYERIWVCNQVIPVISKEICKYPVPVIYEGIYVCIYATIVIYQGIGASIHTMYVVYMWICTITHALLGNIREYV